jgi:hypothetical protein
MLTELISRPGLWPPDILQSRWEVLTHQQAATAAMGVGLLLPLISKESMLVSSQSHSLLPGSRPAFPVFLNKLHGKFQSGMGDSGPTPLY